MRIKNKNTFYVYDLYASLIVILLTGIVAKL